MASFGKFNLFVEDLVKAASEGRVHGSSSIDRAFALLVAALVVSKHPTNGRYTLTARGRTGTMG